MGYSIHPRHRIFVNGYKFSSFAKNMSKKVGKNMSKYLSVKYRQKLLDHAKETTTVELKTASKIAIQKNT